MSQKVNGQYTPDWDSLDNRPLPKWFDDAKIGIFMHAGVYSVPTFGSEWFWINWANNNTGYVDFMKKNYPPNFTYQDFGPMYKMELFDASWYADLLVASGARYIVYTSKHHEGFVNHASRYSFGWNSVDIGPKRDVLVELKEAIKKRDPKFHFGIYYSLFEWFNPMFLDDQANNKTTRTYVLNKMIPEMKQLAIDLAPDVWWSDGDWTGNPDYWGSKDFLAWLYNEAPSKDTVVTNDRWGIGTSKTHGGYWSGADRWHPGQLVPHKWESAFTIDKESWGFRGNMNIEDVLTMDELIENIVETVSCGGNALVNVGPRSDGMIAPIFQERLKHMGAWLAVNGEAIYSTKPYSSQNDSISNNVWYTQNKTAPNVYAISLGWPEGDVLKLADVKAGSNTKVSLLGYKELKFTQTAETLDIEFPDMAEFIAECGQVGCQWAFAVKIVGPERMAKPRAVNIDVVN